MRSSIRASWSEVVSRAVERWPPGETEQEEPKEEIPFLIGQAVAITEGPFTDFNGTVEEVMADKGKVRVSVSVFGRPTSVELDYLQLKAY